MTRRSAGLTSPWCPPWIALRSTLVVCQGVTFVITWPLWQARAFPPNLPLFDLAQLDALQVGWGLPLLASLLVVLACPRIGIVAHWILLAAAMCADQMRIQPQFVSLALLMGITTGWSGARLLTQAHLIATWIYAGGHKLLSHDFIAFGAAKLARDVQPGIDERLAFGLGLSLAILELLLGILALFSSLRRDVAVVGCLLHVTIFLALSPLGMNWNQAVWPWNLGLAAASLLIWWNCREAPWAIVPRAPWPATAAAVFVVLGPATYYLGWCDAHLAHCVYSYNTPKAWLFVGLGGREPRQVGNPGPGTSASLSQISLDMLKVPFPPATRTFESFLHRAGRPGDVLLIRDPRPIARWRNEGERWVPYGERDTPSTKLSR